MSLLIKNINKNYFEYKDFDLNENLNIFKENTKDDDLCKIYNSFPAELYLVEILINELKSRNSQSLLITNSQTKLSYNKQYKDKYIDININYLYKDFYDDFSQDIDDLEKTLKAINKDKKERKRKKRIWKISKSKQFEDKKELITNPAKNFNPFIVEEFNFHKSIYKNKETHVEFPLPVDTYIRMKKHSQKILINYHRPTEMIFLYLFCEYFKIDYLSLRTITKLIEYHIEKIYK